MHQLNLIRAEFFFLTTTDQHKLYLDDSLVQLYTEIRQYF